MKSVKRLVLILVVLHFTAIKAQKNKAKDVDASNPTNLYTQVNTLFEYTSLKDGTNLYGFRGNIQYTFNPNNLVLAEIPILYNDITDAFGLSDIRIRYFSVIKRTMTKDKFSVIAPFLDVTLPTGNFSDGLGSSSYVLSAGSVFA